MKLKIKVCGMREPSNILEVSKLNPDYMGFIFYERSPRFVGKEFTMPSINDNIKRVGVFVNHDYNHILQQAKKFNLRYAQLHGGESSELCKQLKAEGLGVIKVFSIDSNFDFENVKPFQTCADYFLFDTKGESFGGTGKAFDWTLLNNYCLNTPFFISGGLNEENISQVIKISNKGLFALDLNSGVEASPGKKDVEKLDLVFSQLNR